jgi:ribosome recycling factor
MKKTVDNLSTSIIGIHSGTVNPGVIDTIKVQYYGQNVPIYQVAQTGRLDNNNIAVDPYDVSILNALLTAIQSNGFTAYKFSKTRILISIPPACGETKEKVKKFLRKLGEDSKIAIRNIRKKYRKNQTYSDKKIQEITDFYINQINEIIENKITRL